MAKYLRQILAAISLIAMTLLFVVPGAGFCALLGWLPRTQLVPAIMAGETVVIVAIAFSVILFGRLYCSVICPLGIIQDLVHFIFGQLINWLGKVGRHLGKQVRPTFPSRLHIRYPLLLLFIIISLLGFTCLLEPYGIFGRFFSAGIMRFGEPSTLLIVWAIALFVFILSMSLFRARWWCNMVCPVGTFLGLFSRFALFRVKIDETKCTGCGLCAKACAPGAITKVGDKVQIDHSKCVSCFNCRGICPRR